MSQNHSTRGRKDGSKKWINEALAEEERIAEQRRRRDGDAAAAVPVPDSATPVARDPREN